MQDQNKVKHCLLNHDNIELYNCVGCVSLHCSHQQYISHRKQYPPNSCKEDAQCRKPATEQSLFNARNVFHLLSRKTSEGTRVQLPESALLRSH